MKKVILRGLLVAMVGISAVGCSESKEEKAAARIASEKAKSIAVNKATDAVSDKERECRVQHNELAGMFRNKKLSRQEYEATDKKQNKACLEEVNRLSKIEDEMRKKKF